jgi:hypothetical protein
MVAEVAACIPPARPRRLARPRTSPFHGGNYQGQNLPKCNCLNWLYVVLNLAVSGWWLVGGFLNRELIPGARPSALLTSPENARSCLDTRGMS